MNLIFDIGNSGTKMAIFNGKEMVTSFRSREFSCEKLASKLSKYQIDKAIICSVKAMPEYIPDLLSVNIPSVHTLTSESQLPFKIEYETPETLGPDRIAAAAGAYAMFPGKKILIIDAGTAITIDLLTGKAFKGGNISPGINMRFKALHRFTGKLPLVHPTENFTTPGRNTIEAITAGVINGVTYEINEYIRTFEKKYPGLEVIVTGGDSKIITSRISRKVIYAPDIVLEGLNYILEYNAK